jgi:hypothetical protein
MRRDRDDGRVVDSESGVGVRAKCSRCDYLRTFADELRGTYYRCPKCRQGVIAVPPDAESKEESVDAPAVRSARMPDNRSSEEAARALESQSDAPSSADDDAQARGVDETPRGVLTVALADRGEPSSESADGAKTVSPLARGQTFTVRRILVECAGCGHHVAVPPQFFGKTVHCPECRADMAFSESSLEPVKDEILGRIAIEQTERLLLRSAVPPPIESPEARRRAHRRHVMIVIALLLAVGAGAAFLAWKILNTKTTFHHE